MLSQVQNCAHTKIVDEALHVAGQPVKLLLQYYYLLKLLQLWRPGARQCGGYYYTAIECSMQ